MRAVVQNIVNSFNLFVLFFQTITNFFVLKKSFHYFKLLNVQIAINCLPLLFSVASPFVPSMLQTLLYPTLGFISPINIM